MKRLLGVLLLGLGALSMVVVSSAVPGGRSAHALGATSPGQTAKLFIGAVGSNQNVFRYNCTIIISEEDVVVVDATGSPQGAKQIIEEIKKTNRQTS